MALNFLLGLGVDVNEQPVETTLYSLDSATPQPEERRAGDRLLTLLRVGALMVGDRRELCLIKNISAGGMMIRAYSKIEIEERVSVELKQGESVHGVVRWANDDYLGVTFEAPIDVIALISTQANGQQPRMPRIELHCTAWVRDDGTVYRTKTSNVSQGGVKIDSIQELRVGADVTVTLTGLAPQPGIIRWKEGTAYGISFNRVLPVAELVAWLQEQREGPRAASSSVA
jgi:hypothetical protein